MRRLLLLLLLCATACGKLPIINVTFTTPTPLLPTGPTPTPLPATILTFTVHIPNTTPQGSLPEVRVLDEVSGTTIAVPLKDIGNNTWLGSTPATVGEVVRYRYVRPRPFATDEVSATGQPIPYRLALVADNNLILEDTVAAWTDTPAPGGGGALTGVVKNSNTGQGVFNALVSVAGQVALTSADGRYYFFDLPAGPQRVTVIARDGSLRPVQQIANIVTNQWAALDLVSDDPNMVHVNFIVYPPAQTDPSAIFRLSGNVAQLGDTFVLDSFGTAIAPARQPALTPLPDGRWQLSLVLYEGTLLRYKYTLGDGRWNGELDAGGRQRLRQLRVPLTDLFVEDVIPNWHSGSQAPVIFDFTPSGDFPTDEMPTIQFRTGEQWQAPLPLWRAGDNRWRFVLYNPNTFSKDGHYRYCRNFSCEAASEDNPAHRNGRSFMPTLFSQNIQDQPERWRWLSSTPAEVLVPVEGKLHIDFAAGFDFPDQWQPNDLPLYAGAFAKLQNDHAGWVTFLRRGTLLRINPPLYGDDLALSASPGDIQELAHQARGYNLHFTLHPVTCHYTPYGACDYWNGAPYSTAFWDAWFAAYQSYLLTQADLATQATIDMLVVGDFKLRPSFPGEPEAPPDAETRWRSVISNVRTHYRGKLAFELLMGQNVWPNVPGFLDAVDVIRFAWWSTLANTTTPKVSDLSTAAGMLMDANLLPIQQRFNRPIQISAAYLAADGAATHCLKRDDGQCYSFEAFNPDQPDVARYPLDLVEQADAFNGLLQAINDRPWISGFSAYGYSPLATLHDKSISVRGKPAEAVLATWYPRLVGR